MVFTKFEKKLMPRMDWELVAATLMLCAIGLAVMYSAGFNPDIEKSPAFTRQATALGASIIVFIVCMLINTSFWRRTSFLIYTLGCILLLVVLLKGVVAGGSRRWLAFGTLRFQPSEFTKIALILALAKICSREREGDVRYGFSDLLLPGFIILIPVVLILRQPDLGTALGHVLIGGTMLLVAGIKGKTLFRLSIGGVLFLIPAWQMLKDYQKQRVLTFLYPEQDPLGAGYHAIQSKIAVGSGMFSGKGFMQGTQTQLRFLPEQTTDFVFSVLAEEWGFAGSIFVIFLYLYLLQRLVKIAMQSTEPYPAFVSIGVAALIFWQTIMNIGMVIGVLPVVGLTLPLLSYGRSSLITVMAALGIVAGFRLKRFLFA